MPAAASAPALLACEDEVEGADADAEPVAEPLDDGDVAVDEGAADTALAVGTLVAFVHWRLDVVGTVAFDDSVRSAHCLGLPISECAAHDRRRHGAYLVEAAISAAEHDLYGDVRAVLEVA